MKKFLFVLLLIGSYAAGFISSFFVSFAANFDIVRDRILLSEREHNIAALWHMIGAEQMLRSVADCEFCAECRGRLDAVVEQRRSRFSTVYLRSKNLGRTVPFGEFQDHANDIYKRISENTEKQ